MKANLLFILGIFLVVTLILILVPSKKPNHIDISNIQDNQKLVQISQNNEYTAQITKNIKRDIIPESNLSPEITTKFKITNVKITDKNGEEKTTFIFNEDIMINFNYELPEGNYVFRLQIEPDLEIYQNEDILRKGNHNTEEHPLKLKILKNYGTKDAYINTIKILIYQTDNYDNPLFVYSQKVNLVIQNLKIKMNYPISRNNIDIQNQNPLIKNNNISNNNIQENALEICEDIISNYGIDELQIHIPILEYCAQKGVKIAQEYIEKYYRNLESKPS